MRNIKPLKESNVMVTGEGFSFGLDVRPFDRKTKDAEQAVTKKKLSYSEMEKLLKKLILDS